MTDSRTMRPADGRSVSDVIRAAALAGVDMIQIREKEMAVRALEGVVQAAMRASSSTRIVVNDRLDVALAAGAAGVHLGGESLPVAAAVELRAKGIVPQDFLIGVSCHNAAEVEDAERDGTDYVFFGPVFATPSKEKFGAPHGVARLAEVCRMTKLPVLAIGGINEENAGECLKAGAAGIAAIRLFQDASDLAAAAAKLLIRKF